MDDSDQDGFLSFSDVAGSPFGRFRYLAPPHAQEQMTPPRVVPDAPTPTTSSTSVMGVVLGIVVLFMVGLTEGTLAWGISHYVAQIGWLDATLPWWPCAAIGVMVNGIYVVHRGTYNRL